MVLDTLVRRLLRRQGRTPAAHVTSSIGTEGTTPNTSAKTESGADPSVQAQPPSVDSLAGSEPTGRWRLSHPRWGQLLVVELCIVLGLALLFVAGWIIQQFSHFLLLMGAAIAIALLVAPAVQALEHRVPNRAIAAGIVYLVVIGSLGIGLALITVPLVREATDFARTLPEQVERLPELARDLEGIAAGFGISIELTDLARRATTQVQAGGVAVLMRTVSVVAGITTTLADIALALVLSFYLSVDGPRLRDQVARRIPSAHLPRALRVEASIRRVFGGYLRGQIILGLVLGVVAGIGAALFGLPYPVVIGVLAGVFELVPMFGSLLGAVPAVILALFQPFPTVLWVVLFFFAVNQAENYILAPRITGEALGLSPFYILVALLLGIELAGFLGAILAVPMAALLRDLTRSETTV